MLFHPGDMIYNTDLWWPDKEMTRGREWQKMSVGKHLKTKRNFCFPAQRDWFFTFNHSPVSFLLLILYNSRNSDLTA